MHPAPSPILLSANSSWNLLNFRGPIIRALVDSNYRVAAAVPPDNGMKPLRALGVEVHPLTMSPHGLSPVEDLGLLAGYSKMIRRLNPSAFLGFTIKPNVYGSIAASRLGIPVFNTISGLGTSFLSGRSLQFLTSSIYRVALWRSERVFFHNPDDRDLFVSHRLVRASKTAVVAGSGVDLNHFAPSADPQHVSPTTFLFIGRLLRDKGAKEFVEAASLVLEKQAALFKMLGSADDHPKALARAELEPFVSSGVIELLGQTDDVRKFIAAADCIVLPSYREGLPRVLLEASAMGKPVIATDVPGCRHAVNHGRTGLLCMPRSSESLANAITEFLNLSLEERRTMGTHAREKAVLEFSDQEVAATYLAALRAAHI